MTSLKQALVGTVSAVALVAGLALGADALAADQTADADAAATSALAQQSISRDPTDLPGPITRREPATVKVHLTTIERQGQLADGTTFTYWTFDGKVPGPMIRARVGDTVEVSLTNDPNSTMAHSVDMHAVTGPGGGAVATQTMPGETTSFRFKALKPGAYVYHCATPMVADHIQAGMYGLVVVEPAQGLPTVDREFYVMQGEVYTDQVYGKAGEAYTDYDKLMDEKPEYYVFNGAAKALTGAHAMHAKVGETVRLFFGDGGPNKTSSFHVIGEIMDKVYSYGSLSGAPVTDVQTVTVAPGGATVAEVTFEVPGRYLVVDHALSRLERGLVAQIAVDGPQNPQVFDTEGSKLSMAGH
ncbi:nitrite reductase (NO-forming) [Tistlia consotensis]|uniref:Copper-containing nitrite reductase n=1 Tax=Tistlia consotensis USBA 355 TaxID=560819 RepID=A0A1Y6CDU2_9PROT|nr:copper-containing nitrite reductase [Tistlia consotensis]SMF56480.1 nitrite reductase (NO-forming) [Tistlia consotensis USBA 355]SNR44641.1 nitrite reductase (NO-forming) [Tistlia consotensis]